MSTTGQLLDACKNTLQALHDEGRLSRDKANEYMQNDAVCEKLPKHLRSEARSTVWRDDGQSSRADPLAFGFRKQSKDALVYKGAAFTRGLMLVGLLLAILGLIFYDFVAKYNKTALWIGVSVGIVLAAVIGGRMLLRRGFAGVGHELEHVTAGAGKGYHIYPSILTMSESKRLQKDLDLKR